ncbi:hypothetical protein MANES_05G086331v8 [Manihot esculenta]|uniref:Uncharacterized protein n=1 Tax=Manihot esculenta TaxID=3983 RepID=A0ACB7HQL9_MANES|nr:hypothetical protein MANES_05G086331v8 [Manihot esculenta]
MELYCPGKHAWPELVGKDGNYAAAIIEKENNVKAIVVQVGTHLPYDFVCYRVWVWVDENNVVIRTPTVG